VWEENRSWPPRRADDELERHYRNCRATLARRTGFGGDLPGGAACYETQKGSTAVGRGPLRALVWQAPPATTLSVYLFQDKRRRRGLDR